MHILLNTECYITGAPSAPSQAEYSNNENGVVLKWTLKSTGASNVQGYVIEGEAANKCL